MARKRMFDLDIINQESFFDMPMETKALYFLLGMEADDEGFISPKKVLRLYGGTEDSLRVLATRGYIIPFKTGVIVITDWKRNNYLDKNKVKPTIYTSEKEQLFYDDNTQKYYISSEKVKPKLNQSSEKVKPKFNESLTKVNAEENSIEENSIVYNNIYNVEDIIAYLNNKLKTNYKTTTKSTITKIKARLKEGFTIEDFKKVIDKKYDEWYGTDMEKYLRPDTLFGTKFEGYLNQKNIPKKESAVEKLQREIKEAEMECSK
jgi:uncharacterized phage protein (TIGR02220 family)